MTSSSVVVDTKPLEIISEETDQTCPHTEDFDYCGVIPGWVCHVFKLSENCRAAATGADPFPM